MAAGKTRSTFLVLTASHKVPSLASRMIYIHIPEKYDATGFLLLAKSGMPVRLPTGQYLWSGGGAYQSC